MSNFADLQKHLRSFADLQKAAFFPRFFKTGKGEYAEGDRFIGVTVPHIRTIARQFRDLPLEETITLLRSPIHEERLTALLILVDQFQRGGAEIQTRIFSLYLANTKYINNWDLVDLSADKIVGGFLLDKTDRSVLEKLARSKNLFERRIAIIATFQFIKEQKAYRDTFAVAKVLLHDPHDLIHKAVGWMLREVGKRISKEAEEIFLKKHYRTMPRTALRYAIERFEESKRKRYLNGNV